jgi:hypothetical protein
MLLNLLDKHHDCVKSATRLRRAALLTFLLDPGMHRLHSVVNTLDKGIRHLLVVRDRVVLVHDGVELRHELLWNLAIY